MLLSLLFKVIRFLLLLYLAILSTNTRCPHEPVYREAMETDIENRLLDVVGREEGESNKETT